MYLHLGQDYLVKTRDIIGIFDIDTATVAKNTRLFLKRAETEGAVVPLSGEIPKSFILTDFPTPTVYISPISAATLKKRCRRGSGRINGMSGAGIFSHAD